MFPIATIAVALLFPPAYPVGFILILHTNEKSCKTHCFLRRNIGFINFKIALDSDITSVCIE